MLRLIHNTKIPKYFLALAGLVIVAFFALNTYPVGHWFGEQFLQFPGGPEILGIVSAAFIGIAVFIMFFHKEYLKNATRNHSDDTGDHSFENAYRWFVWFVLGLEMCSVAFRWIELNGSKLGWVLLGLGLLGVGMSIVLGKILHAMMNPTPERVAYELREKAGVLAFEEGAEQLPYLTNEQKRQIAAADNTPLDAVRDERAMAREREVATVEARNRKKEEERRKNAEMYQKMISPPDKASGNGKRPF